MIRKCPYETLVWKPFRGFGRSPHNPKAWRTLDGRLISEPPRISRDPVSYLNISPPSAADFQTPPADISRQRGVVTKQTICARPHGGDTVQIVGAPENHQLDFRRQTKSQEIRAKKREAELLEKYALWLQRKGRELQCVKYGGLQCDGYEEKTRNLIEAKSSTRREHIRMAVGQLLDYAFQGRKKLGASNKAILLPKKPQPAAVEWLQPLRIKIIWREGDLFRDNARGRFCSALRKVKHSDAA